MGIEDLVVLLGAGASLPGMCSVADLTKFLLQWPVRREPPSVLDMYGRDSCTCETPGDTRRTLFAALLDIISPTLKDPASADFEKLIYLCEQLGSIFPLPQEARADDFRLLIAPFLAPVAAVAHFNVPSLVLAAQEACFALLNHVSEVSERVSSASHPQALGLATLANQAHLRLFSLNYDDLPYQSGVDFYDGWTGGGFRPVYPWPANRHTLSQLHGSIRWGYHDDGNWSVLHKYDTRDDAKLHRNVRFGPYHFMDNQMGVNAPMITGLRKADLILHRPFGTYFHVFRDELLCSPRWLIVGYGFRDPHVNAALEQARSNWRLRNIEQRIAIVDYHDFALADAAGRERVAHGSGASATLQRLLRHVFPDELNAFRDDIDASVQRDGLNTISREISVWLSGSATAFTSGVNEICTFLELC